MNVCELPWVSASKKPHLRRNTGAKSGAPSLARRASVRNVMIQAQSGHFLAPIARIAEPEHGFYIWLSSVLWLCHPCVKQDLEDTTCTSHTASSSGQGGWWLSPNRSPSQRLRRHRCAPPQPPFSRHFARLRLRRKSGWKARPTSPPALPEGNRWCYNRRLEDERTQQADDSWYC